MVAGATMGFVPHREEQGVMRTSLAAAVLAIAALAASSAQADGGDRHRHHRGPSVSLYYGAPLYGYHPRYYAPRPPVVIYRAAPPPVIVYERPRVYYAEPAPIDAVPASPVFTDRYGRPCREFQSTITVGGYPRPGFGTACLEPDGQWHIVP